MNNNILIVDDNEANLKVLRVTLEAEGYRTIEASDGIQGLKKLEKENIDAVISDILMPDMDGYHFCQEIRKNPTLREIPFIFYTSTCLAPSDEELALEVGADLYFRKPVSGSVMKAALTQLIGKKNREFSRSKGRLGEEHILKQYNQILVRKLEEKNLELEGQNNKLLKEIKEKDTLQSQFLQAQKMEAVGQLAGGIAHDFNNLLSVILGYSDFILKSPAGAAAGDTLVKDVEEIKNAATRAATLTRQLLAFSRRQILQPEVLNLNNSVTGMEKMLRRLIGENIDMMTILEPTLDCVKADAGQIEQVIMNLVVNARDAMPQGGKLTIMTENTSLESNSFGTQDFSIQQGPYVMISINDTGHGMKPEIKSRIFEPFFTTKESGKGTGLGLSTVYGIIKQSGGYILVESQPGQGATFRVYLPQVKEEVKKPKAPKPLKSSDQGSKTILVVDDDEKIRNMINRFLHSRSYNVMGAADGQEALSLCENHKAAIDLVITDVLMPGLSGIDLGKKVRTIHSEIKMLYMSGYTDQATFREEVPELKTNFLMKPFTSDVLIEKIREILNAPQESPV